jgi:hypothetical protein
MRSSWARALLVLSTAGYLTALIAVAPLDNPMVALLALVPLVIAGGFFGLRAGVVLMIGLTAATVLVIELIGPGRGAVFETYRGIPLLMFVMIGIVVGRLRDRGFRRSEGHLCPEIGMVVEPGPTGLDQNSGRSVRSGHRV